ncbi:prepilin-type N-terminal cleavage/methylation domain-containing protein, partial [Bdellovibrionales bacterium]|nr:prepilin-type N-terminal cleavage/methylation domain-containing protein [Bdellovibrionales bacterium]
MRNQIGMSLIEVMIAVGVTGIASVGMLKLTENNMKSNRAFETKNDALAIVAEIRSILSDPDSCKQSLETKRADNSGNTIPNIQKDGGAVKFTKGSKYGSVLISNFVMSDSGTEVEVLPNDIGDTYLEIEFDRGDFTFGGKIIKKSIKLWVRVNPSKEILECRAYSSGENALWERTATDPYKIFYSGGNVGIGVSDPVNSLSVDGAIQLKPQSDKGNCNDTQRGKIVYQKTAVVDKIYICIGTGWTDLKGETGATGATGSSGGG